MFTHDNRLTTAVKDLSLPATILEVTRQPRSDATAAGVWPRTAATLARQALEAAVDARWLTSPQTVAMTRVTMRSQLTCLPAYLDEQVARQIAFAYAALTAACHYHPYELATTAAELTGWIADVEALVAQLSQAAPRSA